MFTKRCVDLLLSFIGLLVLLPVFLIIAIAIKVDTTGPVFFSQERVGRFGHRFRIFKFRTMVVEAESLGKQLTVGADRRITKIGHILRKYKLDELPQLINVIRGDMSLVGPRPEVPYYMQFYNDEIRQKILSVPPGITDFASIEYVSENAVLADSDNPEKSYIEIVMPHKAAYYLKYVSERSTLLDIKIIFLTLKAIIWRPRSINLTNGN